MYSVDRLKESVEHKASELGIQGLSETRERAVVNKVKEQGTEKKGLIDDSEFRKIVILVLKGT